MSEWRKFSNTLPKLNSWLKIKKWADSDFEVQVIGRYLGNIEYQDNVTARVILKIDEDKLYCDLYFKWQYLNENEMMAFL